MNTNTITRRFSMYRFLFISFALSSTLLFAQPLSQEQAVQKGSAAAAALLQKLGGELKGQMQSGGPMAALRFCSQNALFLTDEVAKESNTTIKRVSLKHRNPVNAATNDEKALLEKWETLHHSGKSLPTYEIQQHTNGGYTYFKPILINNEACLKCHGDIGADSPLFKAIKAIYPEDQATGYGMGDLRGMIVITLPK